MAKQGIGEIPYSTYLNFILYPEIPIYCYVQELMAIKKDSKTVVKVEKKIRQKILVEEGGRMNSDIPCKTVYNVLGKIFCKNSPNL